MAGYVYGGTEFDAHLPIPRRTQRTRTGISNVIECGSNSGYTRHLTKKEAACRPCQLAHNDYMQEWKKRKKAAA